MRGFAGSVAAFVVVSMVAFSVPASEVASAAPAGAPLIQYSRAPGGNWSSFNVSGTFGLPRALFNAVPFVDPITGNLNEYATATNNHLIEYTRIASGKWIAADITLAAAGPSVTNDPAPFLDPLTGLQNVYSTSTFGHLIEFTRLDSGNWTSIDLTAAFGGPPITSDPVPFVDPAVPGRQLVYVTATDGHVIEYSRAATRWNALDLTNFTAGSSIFNDPEPAFDATTHLVNVYGATSFGDLVEFTRMPAGNWISVDITGFFGGPSIQAQTAPFTDPVTGFQNVYATTTDNHLAEYTRLGNGVWTAVDLTASFQGAPVPSSPAPFLDGGIQAVFATTNASHLVEYIRQPAGNWIIIDITAAFISLPVPGDPIAFIDPQTHFLNAFATGI